MSTPILDMAIDASRDPDQELALIGDLSEDDVAFSIAILEQMVGTQVNLGFNDKNGEWVVILTCKSGCCQHLTSQYVPISAKTPTRAMRLFMERLLPIVMAHGGIDTTKH